MLEQKEWNDLVSISAVASAIIKELMKVKGAKNGALERRRKRGRSDWM